jgi:hypothetical protein
MLAASLDVIVATLAAALALLILYPITLCAAAVKWLLAALNLRPAPSRKPALAKGFTISGGTARLTR